MHWTIAHAQRGSHCGDSVRIDEGHAPLDAVSLGDVMMTASARPLEAYRTVLRAIAHDRCAQGAVLLRADEDARGVVSVHARLWDNATQPPAATP